MELSPRRAQELRPTRGPSIVLAEDDDVTAMLLGRSLEREGYRVVRRVDGVDALDEIRSVHPVLIILDVGLPKMNGFDVLRHVRDDPATAAIPVMMLTGKGSERDIVHGLALGADAYVAKPFSSADVLARVRDLVFVEA